MAHFFRNIGFLMLVTCYALGIPSITLAFSHKGAVTKEPFSKERITAFSAKSAPSYPKRKNLSISPIIAPGNGFKLAPGVAELLQFTPSSLPTNVPSGRKKEIKVYLNNSDEDPVRVKLSAAGADGVVPEWLLFKGKTLAPSANVFHSLGSDGNEIFFTIDASALAEGDYRATVKAEANGYLPADLAITLTVSSFNEGLRPYVTEVRPADGSANVRTDQSVSVDLAFPSGKSIDGNTVNLETVKLFKDVGGVKVEVTGTAVNTTAAGDAITLTAPLELGKSYEFLITDRVKDGNGYAMLPFSSRFTTATTLENSTTDLTGVSFTEQILIGNTFGSDGFTSLAIGPDRRLYATTSGGKIERWDIMGDGTLSNHHSFSPFGLDRRLLIGFTFDPAAAADNLIAWISHSAPEFTNVADWTGKVSRVDLNDPDSPQIQDYITNLPRSIKDHATNGLAFGPDRALYILQGGNNAMGAPDGAWGGRPERLLSAALLRLDISRVKQQRLPLDAKTEEGGFYNPYAANAPLTIYATGIRNAYDMVWHSNGQLYVPTNGSAAGGNTPALRSGVKWSNGQVYTGPTVPAMQNVRATQNDYLFRVEKGGYYGHPNPLRDEFILNGGNPTAGEDPGEVTWFANGRTYGYPVGTQPEPNYRGWAFNFGLNKSPNGVIEYKSNAFEGKLQGKLLVCRFSGGDDIMVLEPGLSGMEMIQSTEGSQVPGFRRPFANPLDLVEDPATGNLYMSEYFDGNGDGKPRITLLKANKPASPVVFTLSLASVGNGVITTDPKQVTFAAGTQVTLSADPAAGFEFAGWSGDTGGTLNPLTLTMDTHKTVTALFKMGAQTDGTIRINAGGAKQVVSGKVWSGCTGPAGCTGYVAGGGSYIKSPAPSIAGVPPGMSEALFRTAWTTGQNGSPHSVAFTYTIPVTNGDYLVRLYFAELDMTGPGQRIFDVNIEGGRRELVGLDVYKEAKGPNMALFREIPKKITDGSVTIDFIRRVGHPLVSAIEIVPDTANPSAEVSQPGQGLWVSPNPAPGDKFMVDLEGFGSEETVSLAVHDASGRVVRSFTLLTDRGGAYSGPVLVGGRITKGFYLLRAVSATGKASAKLLVQ
jgi:hypothetical protein